MPKNLGDIKVERQGNETLKLGIGTGAKAKSGGSPRDLGYITVDRAVKKPPTKSPAK
jgi:hypothetical protein